MRTRYSYISRSKRAGILFLLPGLAGVSFFVLIPFGDVFLRSFQTSLSGHFVGLQNYQTVFQNTAFRLAVANTLKFMLVCVPLLLGSSLALALLLNSSVKWEGCKQLFLLPLAVPTATVVLVWRLLFEKQGFLNHFLGTHIDFMETGSAFFILVGSYLWKNLGYTLILWIAGLKAIPQDILDAAKMDGAGKMQCFFRVTLPNLKGSIYTITVLSLLSAFKSFREVYLVSGAYPQKSIYLLQNVFHNWYTNLDFDKMAAGAVICAVVLGSISLLLQRLWNRDDG